MKKLYTLLFSIVLSAPVFSQVCDSLVSPCVSTFSRNGYFFDIEATGGAVLIEHISTMSQNCGSRDFSIYYRTSTYLGNESSYTGWTLAGSLAAVTPLCALSCPIPVTPINIPINLTIPMGQRYGFYVTMTAGTGTLESHSNLVEGSIGAQDAMITLYTGKGQGSIGAFTGVLTASLTFQGTIQYSCVTSVAEELSTNQVSVFPNPSSGIFTLQSTEEITAIEIYNVLGENISPLSFRREAGGEVEIDLSAQPKGIYFIKVQSGDKVSSQKIIIN